MSSRFIFPALLLLPLAEIAMFVLVGQKIGVMATIGLVLVSTLLGLVVIRRQGLGMAKNLNAAQMNPDEASTRVMGGMLHMVAGLLLAVPGFITSALGLLLLLPLTRNLMWRTLKPDVVFTRTGGFYKGPGQNSGEPRHGPSVIDLDVDDFHRDEDGNDPGPNGTSNGSPWAGPRGHLPK